jgi:hypothetical protein
MEPHRDDHGVGTPPVHLAHDPQGHMLAKPDDVAVGVFERRPVVEHQQQAGKGEHEEQEEAHASHAPRVTELDARLPDPHRVQMQKDVRQHDEHAIAVGIRPVVPEDRRPDLRFGQPVPEPRSRPFLWFDRFGFCGHVC